MRLHQKITSAGVRSEHPDNYGHHLANLALHFGCVPTGMDRLTGGRSPRPRQAK
ncbi:MAG: hypothetical protein U5L96_17905 [Owenweeksia sp.]|nr:hypothetical protein [Owenweeksia sp.]